MIRSGAIPLSPPRLRWVGASISLGLVELDAAVMADACPLRARHEVASMCFPLLAGLLVLALIHVEAVSEPDIASFALHTADGLLARWGWLVPLASVIGHLAVRKTCADLRM